MNNNDDKYLQYNVSKEEQIEINKSPSKTLPVLIFWIIYLIFAIVFKILSKSSICDLSYITIIAGAATFTYMGIDYTDAFIKNTNLPKLSGKVEYINRYAKLVYTWCFISLLFTIAQLIGIDDLPIIESLTISGTLSVEYIAGNKMNKIATTMGKGEAK